jgi:hypothetical protein
MESNMISFWTYLEYKTTHITASVITENASLKSWLLLFWIGIQCIFEKPTMLIVD